MPNFGKEFSKETRRRIKTSRWNDEFECQIRRAFSVPDLGGNKSCREQIRTESGTRRKNSVMCNGHNRLRFCWRHSDSNPFLFRKWGSRARCLAYHPNFSPIVTRLKKLACNSCNQEISRTIILADTWAGGWKGRRLIREFYRVGRTRSRLRSFEKQYQQNVRSEFCWCIGSIKILKTQVMHSLLRSWLRRTIKWKIKECLFLRSEKS